MADIGERTVIFTIARMNPPTSGHIKLIQLMMEAANNLSMDDPGHKQIYLILSHTQDNVKNPLTCKRKRELLNTQGMIQRIKTDKPLLNDITVNIFCMDDIAPESCGKHPILKQVCHIILLEHPTRMKLFIGEDRADSYNFVQDSIAKNDPPIYLEMVVLQRPEGAMSATFMRGLVTDGKREEFIRASIDNGLSGENANDLFDELDYVMKIPSTVKRRKVKGGRITRRRANNKSTMNKKKRRSTNKRSKNKRSNRNRH
jgi:nicotinamide mononucleotide adenylyltransferase